MIDRCCISLTEKCNLRCRYCHFSNCGRRADDMTLEETESAVSSILNYVEKHDTDFKVGLVGGGEPALRTGLLQHVVERLESEPRIRMYTVSNATVLDDGLLDFLYIHRNALEYCVSLDGPRHLHDANRIGSDGRGTYDRVMESVRRYEERFGHKPAVNCTVTPRHLSETEELIGFFTENGFSKVTFSKLFDSEDTVDNMAFEELLRSASPSLRIRQLSKNKTYDCTQYGTLCGVGRTNIYIASGKVYPCARFAGMERYCLGTVNVPLDEIESELKKLAPCTDGQCYYDNLIKIGELK